MEKSVVAGRRLLLKKETRLPKLRCHQIKAPCLNPVTDRRRRGLGPRHARLGLAGVLSVLRLKALTQLTFRNDAPRRLWGFLAAQPERVTYSLSAYFSGGRLTSDVALACVTAALLRHSLLVADDDDVLQGHPLQPFMLRKVLQLYKPAAFSYCWSSPRKMQ